MASGATGNSEAAQSVDLRICLLGGFRVSIGRRHVEDERWRLRKARSLLKLLALAPGYRLHRDQVTDLLWPELGSKAALNNLHYVLYTVRHVLEPASGVGCRFLNLRDEQLTLSPGAPLWVDVEVFEEAAAMARGTREPAAYRAALELYNGELLPEDRYEDWTAERRTGLHVTYLALLEELAKAYQARHEPAAAIDAFQRLVQHEPAHEGAQVSLIRLYADRGQCYRALRQYEQLREILERELGTEPGADARQLYAEVLSGRTSRAWSPATRQKSELSGVSRHNLPMALTSFVGREREVSEIGTLLLSTRLLTLVGTGGSGKTRLALEAARGLLPLYPDGVRLVELGALSESGLVPQAVAATLSVREQPGRSLTATLVDALRHKKLLLVLDNCEHLVACAAQLAETLLSYCPELRILATSREVLGVPGEVSRVVHPLSLVAYNAAGREIPESEAERLFVNRARQRRPDLKLTGEDYRAVAEICHRLDGIPLAIELAAARVGLLTVGQISARLDDALGLLAQESRTAVPRHRSLRATLDWSYQLLDEREQTLFARLSVFADGWTLEAAEAVGSGDPIEQAEVLDVLSRLVDKSLVVAKPAVENEIRYKMLQPVVQYGREKLEASKDAEAVRDRHATWLLPLSERTLKEMDGPRQGAWLTMLEAEHDNLRAALKRCLEDGGKLEVGLRLAAGLFPFWVVRGHVAEGRGWLRRLLSSAASQKVSDPTRAAAFASAGILAQRQGDYEPAIRLTEESLDLWRKLGDQPGVANCLNNLCAASVLTGDYGRADRVCEESLALSRTLGFRAGIVSSLIFLGAAARTRGDLGRSRTLFLQGEQACSELGMEHTAFAGLLMAHLGQLKIEEGDYASARAYAEKGLELGRSLGDTWSIPLALRTLAKLAGEQGDDERATALSCEAFEGFRAAGFKHDAAECLEVLVDAAGTQGRYERQARLLGTAHALREDASTSRLAVYSAERDPRAPAGSGKLDRAVWEAAFAQGRAMPPEEAIEYALSKYEPASGSGYPPVDQAPDDPLTRREREVALLVARGLPNREIARELMISERTTENHVAKTLHKLGFRSRSQIACWIAERRLS